MLTPSRTSVGVEQHERAENMEDAMSPIEELKKPSNAGWTAKIVATPDMEVRGTPAEPDEPEHQFHQVEIMWYGTDRVKIVLRDAGPALIRQAYLPGAGQNVIIDLVAERGGAA